MKKKRPINVLSLKALLGLGTSMAVAVAVPVTPMMALDAQALTVQTKTQTVTIDETTSNPATKTVTIPGLKSVSNVRVDNGTVSYTVNGNQITFTAKDGTVTKTQPRTESYVLEYQVGSINPPMTTKTLVEDFTWDMPGMYQWKIAEFESYGDSYWNFQGWSPYYEFASSLDIKHNETAGAKVVLEGSGSIEFDWGISSEENYDIGRVYVDGTKILEVSGSRSGTKSYTLSGNGPHTIKFEYQKDGSVDKGEDRFWIDNFKFHKKVPNFPETYYYSENYWGYSGTLYKKGEAEWVVSQWMQYYEGTVSRTVTDQYRKYKITFDYTTAEPLISVSNPTNSSTHGKNISVNGVLRDPDNGQTVDVYYRITTENGTSVRGKTKLTSVTSNTNDQSFSGTIDTSSLNGTYKLYVWAEDASGLASTEEVRTITVDTVAPNAPTLTPSTTAPTNQNVSVNISYPSDASTKQYRINGGEWQTYSSPIVMAENGTVEARAIDQAGNVSTISSLTISNIDQTPPANATFSPSTTAPTKESVSITINFPTDAVTKQYKIGATGVWTTYSSPVVVTENTTIFARSIDAVGNVSAETSYVVNNVDTQAPTTPTFSADKTTPTNTDVIVTISYPADAVVKEYRVNGGSWQSYSSPITFTQNGTVEARATDEAGNVSPVGTYNVTNIDKTPPQDPTFVASETNPTNQDVIVTINFPADATVKQYKVGASGSWTNYSTPITLTANETIYARAYDAVGNASSEVSFVVSNIDKVAPNQPTIMVDKTTPTSGSVVVTVTFPSDAVVKQYRVNNGAWTAYTDPVTFMKNGTLEARAIDQAGNISNVARYEVNNIDFKAPDAPIVTVENNANTITLSGSEGDTIYYQINDGEWTEYISPIVTEDGTYTIKVKAVDEADNESPIVTITETMYRDALAEAREKVKQAEEDLTQENINLGSEKVDAIPHDAPEYQELKDKLDNLQKIVDAKEAVEKAKETKDEKDLQDARDKIDLLDEDDPTIIDLLDEIEQSFEEADIMSNVAKERYDIISSKYGMSRVAYDALVRVHFAMKYPSNYIYKMATEKVALVPESDLHYDFVQQQFEALKVLFAERIEERIQTEAEIKAEAYVASLEKTYSPTVATEAQKWIDAVENEIIRADLQARLDTAKAGYEAKLSDKAYQTALDYVQKAEQYQNQSYVRYAYEKIEAVADETLKAELTARLQALEEVLALQTQVKEAIKYVEYAEKYKSHYVAKAQEKIDALSDDVPEKTELQARLDAVKAEIPAPTTPSEDDKAIANAEKYLDYAEKTKNQAYINKAQEYINQITDEVKKAELQARLDAITA